MSAPKNNNDTESDTDSDPPILPRRPERAATSRGRHIAASSSSRTSAQPTQTPLIRKPLPIPQQKSSSISNRPTHPTKGFYLDDPNNAVRLEVEEIISRREDDPQSLTKDEYLKLKPSIAPWHYPKTIPPNNPKRKGDSGTLLKLQEKRREILEGYKKPVTPRIHNQLGGQVLGNPELGRGSDPKEVMRRILQEARLLPLSKPMDAPSDPSRSMYTKLRGDYPEQQIPKKTPPSRRKTNTIATTSSSRPATSPVDTDDDESQTEWSDFSGWEPQACSGADFINIIQPAKKNKNCNRAGAWASVLPVGGMFNSIDGKWTWRNFPKKRNVEKSKTMFMGPSRIPESQIQAMEYLLINPPSDRDLKNIKRPIESLIYSSMLMVVYQTAQELRYKHVSLDFSGLSLYPRQDRETGQLWHFEFGKQFMEVLSRTLAVGFKTPMYPSPPDIWIKQRQNRAIDVTHGNQTIYYDERNLPNAFPTVCSFEIIKYKQRKEKVNPVRGTSVEYGDFESLLPIKGFTPSSGITKAITKTICEEYPPIVKSGTKIRGLKHCQFILKWADEYDDILKSFGPNSPEFEEIVKKIKDTAKIIEVDALDYDYITFLSYAPWKMTGVSFEIAVIVKLQEGRFVPYTTKQPSQNVTIRQFNAFGDNPERVFPTGLETRLMKLQRYFQLTCPSQDWHASENNWPARAHFLTDPKLPVLQDGEEDDNRLLLLQFVELYLFRDRISNGYKSWYVAEGSPPDFAHEKPKFEWNAILAEDSSVQDKLRAYHTNYCTYSENETRIAIPQAIMEWLYAPENIYEAKNWLRLRYYDLIRNVLCEI